MDFFTISPGLIKHTQTIPGLYKTFIIQRWATQTAVLYYTEVGTINSSLFIYRGGHHKELSIYLQRWAPQTAVLLYTEVGIKNSSPLIGIGIGIGIIYF